jgi:hypothetical protein
MTKKSKGFGKPVHQTTDKYLTQFAKKMTQDYLSQSEAKLVMNPVGVVRMSEVLEEFADPYIDQAQDGEERKKIFSVAMFAWNLALEPEELRQSKINEVVERTMPNGTKKNRADMRLLLEELIARKYQHFNEVNRLIVDFQMKGSGDQFHLSVASAAV